MSEHFEERECNTEIPREIHPDFSLDNYTPSFFHFLTLAIFLCAVTHTFLAGSFTRLGERISARNEKKFGGPYENNEGAIEKGFAAEICYFLGEVEVIFGIWVIPLVAVIFFFFNWDTAVHYIDTRNYVEPMFVVVIMCLAATRPVIQLAEKILSYIARLFGGSLRAWWMTILIIGPLLGSFVTEAGAMTLSALLLSRLFFSHNPSNKLAYATLGLLFVNISVGGILTSFAAPPVLIISGCWNWDSAYMFSHFGWKATSGIALTTICYYLPFHKELKRLEKGKKKRVLPDPLEEGKDPVVPFWITAVHVFLLVWFVAHQHDPPVFIGSFLLFLGFHQATKPHQYPLYLRRPILVGLFLAALVIHGGLQGWWIIPFLSELGEGAIMAMGAVLTAFNDNTAIIYLGSLVPKLSEAFKYALLSGVTVGGGLTVIANAPNPAGQMLLKSHFKGRISPLKLFVAALPPTLILFVVFYFGVI